MPSRAKAPRLPEQGGSSHAEDPTEGYEEEGLEDPREKPPSPAEQPGNRLQHLLHACGGSFWSFFLTDHAFVTLPFKFIPTF